MSHPAEVFYLTNTLRRENVMSTPRKARSLDRDDGMQTSKVPVPSGYMDNERYRQRDVGTGYGRSSGYARNRRYANDQVKDLFRCG